jgi:PAS domain S-box-containing protein
MKKRTKIQRPDPSRKAEPGSKLDKDGRKKILLVEDEVVIARDEAEAAREWGYDVIIATSGEKAIEKVRTDPSIDIVLMDIDLGTGIDGTDAAKQMLALRNLPILFLTSHSEREMVEKVRGITRYGYVIKSSGDFVIQSSLEMAFELFDAHKRTEDSEALHRSILNASPDNITITDLEGRMLMISPSGLNMFGFDQGEEWRGRNVFDFVVPEDRDRALSTVMLMFKEGAPRMGKYHVRRDDGKELMLEVKGDFIRNAEGYPTRMVLIIRDITERIRAEEALQYLSQFNQEVVSGAGEGIVVYDSELRCLVWNQFMETLTGVPARDVIGKCALDAVPHLREHDAERLLKSALAGDSVRSHDTPFHNPVTGCTRWAVGLYAPRRNKNLDIIGVTVIIQDITDRRRAEEALRESKEIFDKFMENSPIHIYIKDENLRLIKLSKSFEELLGKPLGEMLGRDSFELVPAEFAESAIADDLKTLREGKIVKTEEKLNGRIYSTIKFPIKRDAGKSVYLGGFSVDITERKQMEERINDLLAEKELILREVHHRIKNNMFIMMSLLTLQSNALDDPRAAAALMEARSRMKSMGVLYDKLYRSGDLRGISIRDYFTPLIDEIVGQFPNRLMVKIETSIDDVVLDSQVMSPLGIMMNELLSNSMKYAFAGSGEGLIKVSASLKDHRLTLVVEDNGIGIPASVDVEKPTGFGLQLIHLLAEQLGGIIRIEGRQGTRFALEFDV